MISGVRVYGAQMSPTQRTLGDLVAGAQHWRLWLSLGWQEILRRYRRALLGPFWITISMACLVFALGIVYGGLFGVELRTFLPHIAASFVVWLFFATTINEATNAFIGSEGMIKHGSLPMSTFVYRAIWSNLIILAHNLVVMIPIYILYADYLNFNFLFIIPGIALCTINLFWMALVVGILSARFRDLPPIVASLVQMLFFISPVLWKRDLLPPGLTFIANINPLAYFIEVVRSPLLGSAPSLESYLVMIGMALMGSCIAFITFRRTRTRIAYWI